MFIMPCVILQHAHALELLKDRLTEGKKALDVGSGSGYLTTCMGLLVSSRLELGICKGHLFQAHMA